MAVFYLLDDEGLLFSEASGAVYRLNTSAAFIWCCCEEGLSPLQIAGLLAERFAIPISIARRDVLQTFVAWQEAGLLAESSVPEPRYNGADEPTHPFASPQNSPITAFQERYYRLFDCYWQIRYPCQATMAQVHPVFKHLEVEPDAIAGPVAIIIDLVPTANGYVMLKNRIVCSPTVQRKELAPLLQREALLSAYEHTECLAAIHSASVCNDQGRCLLLPATSGSGKSTLTAALLDAGFTYLSDELNLLMAETYTIHPAPVSLALKRGSWPILESRYPVLKTLPRHLQDGIVEVKYLSPPEGQTSKPEYGIHSLVFPKYRANASTILTKLTPADALYRVAEAGYDVPGHLNKQTLEALINWIVQLDCYELQVGSVDEAVYTIKELLA